jgi:hypothetical protein
MTDNHAGRIVQDKAACAGALASRYGGLSCVSAKLNDPAAMHAACANAGESLAGLIHPGRRP